MRGKMRDAILIKWLEMLDVQGVYGFKLDSLKPASSDASFRRYFSIDGKENTSFIIMDAPPEYENCKAFIDIAHLFSKAMLTPEIFAKDLENGFLLISHFGNTTLFHAIQLELKQEKLINLNQSTHLKEYQYAIDLLINLHLNSQNDVLTSYSKEKLHQEMHLFNDWYLPKYRQIHIDEAQKNILEDVYSEIIKNNIQQTQVYVHRDYHSRNLMKISTSANEFKIGVLDFQDALYGPVTYDLVSLLKDAYVELMPEQQESLVYYYWLNASNKGIKLPEFSIFVQDYDYMGLQRHLKVLGIFARLYFRDGKEAYLKDIPLVLKYTLEVANKYDVFKPLVPILNM
jgi:N-acetylmuramate 1-kinase